MDTQLKRTKGDWSISDMPPPDNEDVGVFFHNLYMLGESDKERLGLLDRWRYNHKMFRGDHWDDVGVKAKSTKLSMNLIFANLQRTVANLTAKQPVVEATEVGNEMGQDDSTDKDLTAWLKKWWSDTGQGDSLIDSANQMELYGPTIEKAVLRERMPDTVVVDPFAFGKAPGVYDDIQDCPYVYHLAVMRTDEIEQAYGLEKGDVEPDDVYTIMGEDREDNSPQIPAGAVGSVLDRSSMSLNNSAKMRSANDQHRLESRALVVELWCKDYGCAGKEDGTGHPDGVRVVTFVNSGKLVLSDERNPNINWELFHDNPEAISSTYLFGKYPFRVAASYRDKTTNWGFSALEQTADINQVLDEIISRFYAYIVKSMMPVLIVPKDTGIKPIHLNNKPGLLLQPASSSQAGSIRYMDPPRMSQDIYQFISLLRDFFDQIWHIEDADRGQAPSGVIAAQAIQALQERNAVLMRAKIRSIDSLVTHRGRCAISMLQNFVIEPQLVKVNDDIKELVGTKLVGRYFDFVVESGSTVHKTTMQTQEQAVKLFEMGVIDRQALLENLNFPGWKAILERVGETQVDQALQILTEAGLAPEEAASIKQYVVETQQGQVEEEQAQRQPGQQGVPA